MTFRIVSEVTFGEFWGSICYDTGMNTTAIALPLLPQLSDRLEWAKTQKEARLGSTVPWADLARASGASEAAVSRWRKNLNGIDSRYARKLAHFLGVDPVWLETGKGKPHQDEPSVRDREAALEVQLSKLIAHFFAATPYAREQLLDFASTLETFRIEIEGEQR